MLERVHEALLRWSRDTDGISISACPPGSTNPVDIDFFALGEVEIDHMSDVSYIEAPSCYIGRHEELKLAAAQFT